MRLKVQQGRRTRKWFILGLPDRGRKWLGPYPRKTDGERDARALRWFYRVECKR